jgi:hypothetical protein
VPAGGHLIARGRLVHASRQLGLTEVFVTDDIGRLIAHGTSRGAIFPPHPSIGPPLDDVPLLPQGTQSSIEGVAWQRLGPRSSTRRAAVAGCDYRQPTELGEAAPLL